MLPRVTENNVGGFGGQTGLGGTGETFLESHRQAVPLPARPCTPRTRHGGFRCLALALALLVSPSEPLGIAGKEEIWL